MPSANGINNAERRRRSVLTAPLCRGRLFGFAGIGVNRFIMSSSSCTAFSCRVGEKKKEEKEKLADRMAGYREKTLITESKRQW